MVKNIRFISSGQMDKFKMIDCETQNNVGQVEKVGLDWKVNKLDKFSNELTAALNELFSNDNFVISLNEPILKEEIAFTSEPEAPAGDPGDDLPFDEEPEPEIFLNILDEDIAEQPEIDEDVTDGLPDEPEPDEVRDQLENMKKFLISKLHYKPEELY